MRVLIDECAPYALRNFLFAAGHETSTVQEAGWSGKQNGELLGLAESLFDVFISLDTNLRFQQNMIGRRLAIVILRATSNRLEHLQQYFPACAQALRQIRPGEIVEIPASR